MRSLLCNIDIIIYWPSDLSFIRTASVLLPPLHKTVLISDNFGVINVLKTLIYYFLPLFSFQSRILHLLEKVSTFYETYLSVFLCYS
jgi:hypothetical protein